MDSIRFVLPHNDLLLHEAALRIFCRSLYPSIMASIQEEMRWAGAPPPPISEAKREAELGVTSQLSRTVQISKRD